MLFRAFFTCFQHSAPSSRGNPVLLPAPFTLLGALALAVLPGWAVLHADAAPIAGNAPEKTVPADIRSVEIIPASVVGGFSNAIGIVTLTARAPEDGLIVQLASADTSVATVPPNVAVTPGRTRAAFVITIRAPAASPQSVTLRATLGETKSATLTILPLSLDSLTLVPDAVTSGETAAGLVTLPAPAAEDMTVTLACDAPQVNLRPAKATIPRGETSVSFEVQTARSTKRAAAKITATVNGQSRSATLKIAPPKR